MKTKFLILIVIFSVSMLNAQEKMKIRMAEIEVFPEFLDEYLEKSKSVGAISVAKEKGVICIFPLQMTENPTQIRVVEIYTDENAYQKHIKTPHFLEYKNATLKMIKSLKLLEMNALDEKSMAEIFRKMKK